MLSKSRLFLVSSITAMLLTATVAQAQRPALTKSVDEPGRTPYASTSRPLCLTNNCVFSFTTVPVGYRLVVTYFSAFYLPSTVSPPEYAYFGDWNVTPTLVPAPTSAGAVWAFYSSPITFYVEPGTAPLLTIDGVEAATDAMATITGYLVAIP